MKSQIIDYPPERLKTFHLYTYQWIDNLYFTLDPADFLINPKDYIDIVSDIFSQNGEGWDGDGEIRLMWIPPFVFANQQDEENTKGIIVWHIKQLENGISWILSPIKLLFNGFDKFK